jgi:DNA repair protein RadD
VLVKGPTMASLIEGGHLARYDHLAPPSSLDLSKVKVRGGDYAIDELEDAMNASTIVGDAVEHYGRFLNGRPAIAFCVTRAHAASVAEQFRQAGWKAESIDGSMSSAKREDLIASLADGRLHVLTSCELISEGVDVPVCAGAILLRPTKSLAMYLQQIGRILRPKPDGTRAVVLDHVGNVHRFGMPCSDRDWSLEGKVGKRKPPDITTCELCFKTVPKGTASKLAETCRGVDGEACPFAQDDAESQKQPPQVVAGSLEKVTDIKPPAKRPTWAKGMALDKELTTGRAWFDLLELADSKEKLKEIAEARGYSQKWVYHQLKERAKTEASINAILTSEPYTDNNLWATADQNHLWALIRCVDRAEASIGPVPFHWQRAQDLARREVRHRRVAA